MNEPSALHYLRFVAELASAPELVDQMINDHPADEILRLLPALATNAARVEADLAGWIDRLRAHGVDWPVIADTLSMYSRSFGLSGSPT